MLCARACLCSWRPEDSIQAPGAGTTRVVGSFPGYGYWEPPVGAGSILNLWATPLLWDIFFKWSNKKNIPLFTFLLTSLLVVWLSAPQSSALVTTGSCSPVTDTDIPEATVVSCVCFECLFIVLGLLSNPSYEVLYFVKFKLQFFKWVTF